MTEALRKEFEELVKHHDLTYAYSDDYRYWSSGEKSWKRIQAMMNQLPYDYCCEVWNKYVDQKILPAYREQFYMEEKNEQESEVGSEVSP